jgi:hypothetical protein
MEPTKHATKPAKRMTLRELLTHAEKCTRDLIEHFQSNVQTSLTDYRDLNRPVRRRSHYPTLLALQNALKKVEEAGEEAMVLSSYLLEQLEQIRASARREVMDRA